MHHLPHPPLSHTIDDLSTIRRRLGGDLDVFFLNPLTCASEYRIPRITFFTINSTASFQFTESGTNLLDVVGDEVDDFRPVSP
jgi:hypothetical protein